MRRVKALASERALLRASLAALEKLGLNPRVASDEKLESGKQKKAGDKRGECFHS